MSTSLNSVADDRHGVRVAQNIHVEDAIWGAYSERWWLMLDVDDMAPYDIDGDGDVDVDGLWWRWLKVKFRQLDHLWQEYHLEYHHVHLLDSLVIRLHHRHHLLDHHLEEHLLLVVYHLVYASLQQ